MIGIISDTHNHNWSVFASQLPNKLNNRLVHTLDETWRAAKTAKEAGCNALIHTGDMFHVRGSVAPSVLNPTMDVYMRITQELDMAVYVLAGNHDLENNDSDRIGNASESLSGAGVTVISDKFIDKKHKRFFLPYFNSCNLLRAEIEKTELEGDRSDWTLFIHAPLNGVIAGIPDNGLSAAELKAFGFKAVFCGHYHNHQVFDGNICSVGALTHQTFGDIGTVAGFIIYDEEKGVITQYPSNAPKFVDFDVTWDELEIIENVQGNFVRARLEDATNAEVEEIREFLKGAGATGIQIVHVPKTVTARDTPAASVEAGGSAKVGLKEWCEANGYDEEVQTEALLIMGEVDSKESA
ncbi:metallophosphoesterase [Shewanella glacialipiscicola]|uniref:metallophosphoesterase n=1 Tax=Shewanella glacialipiscicola TaxID=614069 RepID=UPI003D7BC239